MADIKKLVQRSKKVAFYKVGDKYERMTGFTSMSKSSNPKEYSRQYDDEDGEVTDVTGYSPSIDYAFDQYENNAVHDDIVAITEDELMGSDAVREIVIVDFTKQDTEKTGFEARKREYAVIPSTDGDGTDAYTYSGTFKSKSSVVKGIATVAEDRQSLTFVEA